MGGTKRKSTGVGKRIAAGLLSLSLAFSNLPLVAPRAALAEPAVTTTYPSVRAHIAEQFSQDIAEEVIQDHDGAFFSTWHFDDLDGEF